MNSPHLDIPKPLLRVLSTAQIESYSIKWLKQYDSDAWNAYLAALWNFDTHAERLWYPIMRWIQYRHGITFDELNDVLGIPSYIMYNRNSARANILRQRYFNFDETVWAAFIYLVTAEGNFNELKHKFSQFRQEFYTDPRNAERLAHVGRGTTPIPLTDRLRSESIKSIRAKIEGTGSTSYVS